MKHHWIPSWLLLTLTLTPAAFADHPAAAAAGSRPVGAVYTMDNAAGGNHVLAFARHADGTLGTPSIVATGGAGTGDGLGNQGAVVLSRDRRWLFVCNAGSDEISLLTQTPRGLRLVETIPSQGHRPISLAQHGNLLYVLHAGGATGGADTLTGFLFAGGQLLHIPGASYPLSDKNTGPAEVSFTRDGGHLVVTEKATAIIDTFQVTSEGLLDEPKMFLSPAPPPFGFAAGRHDRIYVTQAAGGGANPGGSSVSSYEVTEDGDLEILSASVPSHQTAACWLTLSRDERFAYTANTPNASISLFSVDPHGGLTLLAPQAATTGTSGAVDLAESLDGRFLYGLQPGSGSIGIYGVAKHDGTLTPMPAMVNLPHTVNGLAAW